MHASKFDRKIITGLLLLSVLISAGCVAKETNSSVSGDKTTSAISEKRTIAMSADTWVFTPNVVRVKKGEQVQIELTGVRGKHSFTSTDLALNVPVEAGQTVTFDVPTDKAGTFEFRCRVPCGPGHQDMVGQVVIEE
ncbi:hypothetical protein A3A67_05235 [Candidatus Peribacteria bacterium RIFCSPLOWO2_01_FULL_51_18]|nr:MAG: hypothetical protein A3C52_02965 [Candidatus Peribacteria bacterium RIFCSPHIGHO2_02_FULL_51_15]OGJ60564.1 MAG: hypothetical protein A3C52_02970 [Candidatus Peribacteria bacterium RIFCSPHIGHO2_02_FULL_51_15]OGJ66737.1 MAG: hypothetical protein A3A67_05235 [Candidatus Peribacteria bacterium RIFCSPLOWO2_01_FULL_51_18]OGJ69584.1 MAG: hypothetical protein A3J34_00055 [Candidatus Peribacteria bacterium RIFCSPLOWO2_02_FULL_51_10]